MENTMSMVKVFENEQFGAVRTVMKDNEPWFVAADVCKALEIGNPSQAISYLDSDEKMTLTTNEGHSGSRGGAQSMNLISEPGLYSLVVRSRKPEAKAFKRWITHEVIPTIRKTGGYINSSQQLVETYFPTVDPDQKAAIGLLFENIRIQQEQLRVAKPKADYFDKLVDHDVCIGLRQFAKELGVGEKRFVKFLLDNKYLYRDKKNRLMPYAEYINALFVLKEFVTNNGRGGVQMLFTPAGRDYFLKMKLTGNLGLAC